MGTEDCKSRNKGETTVSQIVWYPVETLNQVDVLSECLFEPNRRYRDAHLFSQFHRDKFDAAHWAAIIGTAKLRDPLPAVVFRGCLRPSPTERGPAQEETPILPGQTLSGIQFTDSFNHPR